MQPTPESEKKSYPHPPPPPKISYPQPATQDSTNKYGAPSALAYGSPSQTDVNGMSWFNDSMSTR